MRLSIVTPSFRQSDWLRLCVASVTDQTGVEFEHIVQDACSDDATKDWLPKDSRVKAFIEKDGGMYDAVNRGFRRASGEILAYLNCDEQYLPGALKAVNEYLTAHPEVDVLLSDTVVTDPAAEYICHRCSLVPAEYQMWERFPALTCSLFIRRRVVSEHGLYFDTQWRDLGDFFWVLELIRKGMKFAVLPRFTSIFTDTGENMNLKPNAMREKERRKQMEPMRWKLLRLPIIVQYRLQLAARGAMTQKPFDYSLYTLESPSQRVSRHVARPTSFWRGR